MTFLSSPSRYVGVAVLTWVCLWAVLAATLPLFPVDETRYLTVAWEMRHSGDYLLPTLNGAPYSHKPPLLFWLVNILWSVTGGPSIWAARIVPLTASLATLGLTMLLARRMFAGRNNVAPLAGLVFMACPVFMLYGVMIMFDFMQAVFVLLAMVAAWDAYDRGRFRSWLLVGLAMGLGVLAKGPVILVHVLPVMILFPLVMRGQWAGPSLKRWYGGIAVAVLIAAAIGLAWAIPAAVYGGPEFSRMIFWEQSAGRMTKAFAHRRPFWFYIPTLIALILPLILWRPFWTAARKAIAARRDPAVAFLLCWAVPVFVIFSLISGKQPHYLIPMIPAIAILAGRFIADEERVGMWNLTCILPAVLAFVAIGVAQYVPAHHTVDNEYLFAGLGQFDPFIVFARLAVAVIFAVALSMSRTAEAQLLSVILAGALFLGTGIVEAKKGLLDYFDLRPLAVEMNKHKDVPMAFAPEYAGEIGFIARLEKPLDVVEFANIQSWLKAHKNGIVIARYRDKADIGKAKVIYKMPYRGNGEIGVLGR